MLRLMNWIFVALALTVIVVGFGRSCGAAKRCSDYCEERGGTLVDSSAKVGGTDTCLCVRPDGTAFGRVVQDGEE